MEKEIKNEKETTKEEMRKKIELLRQEVEDKELVLQELLGVLDNQNEDN